MANAIADQIPFSEHEDFYLRLAGLSKLVCSKVLAEETEFTLFLISDSKKTIRI